MERIIREYKRLKAQLSNFGEETTSDELIWNEGIADAINKLLEGVSEDIATQLRNGYI